jgi:hypothetical protein
MRTDDQAMNPDPSELSDEQLDRVVGGAPVVALMEEEGLFFLEERAKARHPIGDGVVILSSSLPGGS